MTLRIGVLATLLTVFLLAAAYRKRAIAHTAQPVDVDRFNMAGLDERMKQYDREFRLEGRKHE